MPASGKSRRMSLATGRLWTTSPSEEVLTILIVKTSSLGDVVHNLPVASDILRDFPDAGIDWVVEEPYAPLVGLHSAVRRVIPVALRRWRRRPLGRSTWREI